MRQNDEEVLEEVFDFLQIALQALDVFDGGIEVKHLHSSLDAADESALLITAKVVPGFSPEDGKDPGKSFDYFLIEAVCALLALEGAQMADILDNASRHLLNRRDVVNQAGRNRASRHAVVFSGVQGLRQRHAAVLFDRLEPGGAISANP